MRLLLLVLLLWISLSLVFGETEDQKRQYIEEAQKYGFKEVATGEDALHRNFVAAKEFIKIFVLSQEEAFYKLNVKEKRKQKWLSKRLEEEKVEEMRLEKLKEKRLEDLRLEEIRLEEIRLEKIEFDKIRVRELFRLFLALVLLRMSVLAAAKLFLDYSLDASNAAYSMTECSLMKTVVGSLDSNLVLESVGALALFIFYDCEFAAHTIRYFGKLALSFSSSLLLTAMNNRLLDKIISCISEANQGCVFDMREDIAQAVFTVSFLISLWVDFFTLAAASLLGSGLIIAVCYAFGDGKSSTSIDRLFSYLGFAKEI